MANAFDHIANLFNSKQWGGNKCNLPQPWFYPEKKTHSGTLLIVVEPGFNQEYPIAAAIMRIGFARGWAEAGGVAKLVPVNEIIKEIDQVEKPAVFICEYDFSYLTYSDATRLRAVNLFVWAGIHPRMYNRWDREVYNTPIDRERLISGYGKILAAEPKFVWNSVGISGREWYQGWQDDGLRWETIYPAVDVQRYYHDKSGQDEYENFKMAYVGGYWPEKAQSFTSYLRPWEDILHTFGYDKWPYKNYGGKLNELQERRLYSKVGLVPLVTSPAGWLLAEITERYLKTPACRAFCIADENPALREIFEEEEMLQATNVEHFHDLVRQYLNGKIDTDSWRQRGYEAVLKKHTYKHRALQILQALERR